ncbi:chemotaxis protein CheW, partial [Xanthomonas sp. Kuri4-1]
MHAHTVETAPSDVDGGDALPQFLTFQLGGEMFATSILGISEIIEYRAPTPVPTMPTCSKGCRRSIRRTHHQGINPRGKNHQNLPVRQAHGHPWKRA